MDNHISKPEHSSSRISLPRVTLNEDVIFPEDTRLQFEEVQAALRYHKVIYTDWGFKNVDPTGRSMIINLYGPPGTGKTLAAEAIAGTMGLPYLHIGIAELESKFVGETAKNICHSFRLANEEGAILFFDEADTLLGSRLSSVTQGIDNEINAMRSTLLIELERHEGIVIFATNFAKNYDPAFVSRIRYHIEFKLPDLNARRKLFAKFLVPGIPLQEDREHIINTCSESAANLSGRDIRNVVRIALPKAFMRNSEKPIVFLEDLFSAIEEIKKGKNNVGARNFVASSENEIETGRRLLGITG